MALAAWDGVFNFSDVGGFPTVRGVTRSGVIFRSGRPETLTNQGWQDAKDAGLVTIVDLRNEPERGRLEHDPVVDPSATESIDVIFAPTEDPEDPDFMRVCGPWLDHPRSYADNLRFYPAKFRVVFEAIAKSSGAVLVHCSGGRDRTGLVVAMLLSLAGVSALAIADDYERAVREAHAHQTRHPERARERLYTDEHMDARVAERRAAIIEWVSDCDVALYLSRAGLSPADIAKLRNRLHYTE